MRSKRTSEIHLAEMACKSAFPLRHYTTLCIRHPYGFGDGDSNGVFSFIWGFIWWLAWRRIFALCDVYELISCVNILYYRVVKHSVRW